MSIFSRLGFNYNTSNFGNIVNYTSEVAAYMNTAPNLLSDWQLDEMNTSTVGGYFKNPMATDLINLKTSVDNIAVVANATYFINVDESTVDDMISYAQTLSTEITSFKGHSDRISGVTTSTNTAELPDFNSAMSVGKSIAIMVKQSDNIQNNTPILANFTSLFIKNDVSYSNTTISVDNNTLNNSLTSNGTSNTYTYDSDISLTTANKIISDMSSLYNNLHNRRTGDVNYYLNSLTVMEEFQLTSQIMNYGDVGMYLVNNYIGTDKLINNLSGS